MSLFLGSAPEFSDPSIFDSSNPNIDNQTPRGSLASEELNLPSSINIPDIMNNLFPPKSPDLVIRKGTELSQINDIHVKLIKTNAFIGEVKEYLSLASSIMSNGVGLGLIQGAKYGKIDAKYATDASALRTNLGHLGSAMEYEGMVRDLADFILRNVRYQQVKRLEQTLKGLGAELEDLYSQFTEQELQDYAEKGLSQSEVTLKISKVLEGIEGYKNNQKGVIAKSKIYIGTTWGKFALSTTVTILQKMGTTSLVTSSLSWASSVLGLVVSAIKFHHAREKILVRDQWITDQTDDQYYQQSKLQNVIFEKDQAHKTTHPELLKPVKEILNERNEEAEIAPRNQAFVIETMVDHEKIVRDLLTRRKEELEAQKGAQFSVLRNILEETKNLPLQEMEAAFKMHGVDITTLYEDVVEKQKERNFALLTSKSRVRDKLIEEYPALDQIKEDWTFLQVEAFFHTFQYKDEFKGKTLYSIHYEQDLSETKAQFLKAVNENPTIREKLVHQLAEGIQIKRTERMKAIKALALEKQKDENKVAQFNYNKTRILFGLSFSVGTVSLVLSLLTFFSVFAIPGAVLAIGPLLLLLGTVALFTAGMIYASKRRSLHFSHIYPAKVKFFFNTIAELALRVKAHTEKQSLKRLVKPYLGMEAALIPARTKTKIQNKWKKFSELQALIAKRKEKGTRISKSQGYWKLLGYLKAVRMHERVHAFKRKEVHTQEFSLGLKEVDFEMMNLLPADSTAVSQVSYQQNLEKAQRIEREVPDFHKTLLKLARNMMAPEVPLEDDLIEFFRIQLGINLYDYMDENRLLKDASLIPIAKALGDFFKQDDDDLYLEMQKIQIRKKYLDVQKENHPANPQEFTNFSEANQNWLAIEV